MKNKIVIIGAGGHGKVVADAILKQGKFTLLGFFDDNKPINVIYYNGFSVIGKSTDLEKIKTITDFFIVAIGNNEIRKSVYENLKHFIEPAIIIHPSAIISPSVSIEKGTVILANTVINADASIGENCIINSLSLIDHETNVGNNVHISQGTIVGSNVKICDNSITKIGEKIDSFTNY